MAASIVDNMAQIIASDLAMSRAIPATLAEMDVIQHALARSRGTMPSKAPTPETGAATTGCRAPELVNGQQFPARRARLLRARLGLARQRPGPVRGVEQRATTQPASSASTCACAAIWPESAARRVHRNVRRRPAQRRAGHLHRGAGVRDDGLLVGAVIAKVSIDRLRHWVSHAGTFVTDENGVIMMAHDGRLEDDAMPNSRGHEDDGRERLTTIAAKSFPTLPDHAHRRAGARAGAVGARRASPTQFFAMSEQPTPSLYRRTHGLNSGLSAHMVDPLASWPELLRNHKRDRSAGVSDDAPAPSRSRG